MRLGRRAAPALAAGLALVAAACGGSAPSGPVGGGAAPASSAPQGPVRVGMLVPRSGVYTSLGKWILNGYNLYMDQVGSRAGGRPIETVVADDQNQPSAGVQAVRKLLDQDRVDVVAGVVASPVAAAIRNEVVDARRILLISNAGDDPLTHEQRSPYLFRVGSTNWQAGYPLGAWAYQHGIHTVVTMAFDYAAGYQFEQGFEQSFTQAGGRILDRIWVPLDANDFGPYLTKAKSDRPEAVWAFFPGSGAVHFVQDFVRYGLKGAIQEIGPGDTFDDTLLSKLGQDMAGAIADFRYTTQVDNPSNRRFVADYRAKYGEEPNLFAVEGYDTAQVIVAALNATHGRADADSLAQAMRTVRIDSPRGPFAFDPDSQNVVQDYYIAQTAASGSAYVNKILDVIHDVRDPVDRPTRETK